MRQTSNKARADRVWRDDEDNRDCPRDLLERNGSRHSDGNDDIDIAFDQFSGKAANPLELFSGKSVQEQGVLALDVTKIIESLGQDVEIDLFFLRTACVPKDSDFCSSRALLRVRDQWPNS